MHPLTHNILFIVVVCSNFLPSLSDYSCRSYLLTCETTLSITYPFGKMDNKEYCGYPGLRVGCIKGQAALNISNKVYYIQDISFRMVRVIDSYTFKEECPRPLQNQTSFINSTPLSLTEADHMTIFYNCTSYPSDLLHIGCLEFNNSKRSYAFSGNLSQLPKYNWYQNCEQNIVVPLSIQTVASDTIIYTESDYKRSLKSGFLLNWSTPRSCQACENSNGWCWVNQTDATSCVCGDDKLPDGNLGTCSRPGLTTGLKIAAGILAGGGGGLLLILLFVYRKKMSSLYKHIHQWKNKIRSRTNIEVFLKSYGSHALQRYTYSDVKKMTNSFKDILGEGGYGSVFKGKLLNGRLVAVKVLKKSEGDGEEFINEVSTIGRTNHVNIVSLLGFCSDGSKRALVYEFMVNGSLERFIYNDKNSGTRSAPLGWEKLYHIALGIARGLEYLHRGCNTHILHFDIKPHNILLDQDFNPKISDFGLAKLCPTRDSVVSMLIARGTIGYIAPEVYCRNFGGVSYKSDVYSYGMLVLEMIGGRKNVDATVENSSEIYFPDWIYNRLEKDIQVGGGYEEIFQEETTKRMVLVGLWCIQSHPASRPSMSKVVDMLEGSTTDLEMPPNPFREPPPSPFIDPPASLSSTP